MDSSSDLQHRESGILFRKKTTVAINLVYYLPGLLNDNQNPSIDSRLSPDTPARRSMMTMNRPKVNIGIIGVGYWGRKIVDEYSRINEVNIGGVSDLDEENLRLCAQKYGVTNGYKDYERLLEQTTLDAVSICVPNAQHYRLTLDALEAGKHVLVEKPMALSSRDCRELARIAEQNHLTLSVGHIFRFNNALAEVRRLTREKDYFGRIFLIEMNWVNLEPAFPGRDVIWDQGPHIFDIQNYLMDEWPVELCCTAGAFRRRTGEESAYITSKFQGGTLSMAAISWLVPVKSRQIFITGEVRSARVDAVSQTLIIFERGAAQNLPLQPNNTIRDELADFIQSIVEPGREQSNSASIGIRTIELIEAAKESAAKGETVKPGSAEAVVQRSGA
jgi:UDP-N-acetylglucosamine 3-dehydrogenase